MIRSGKVCIPKIEWVWLSTTAYLLRIALVSGWMDVEVDEWCE